MRPTERPLRCAAQAHSLFEFRRIRRAKHRPTRAQATHADVLSCSGSASVSSILSSTSFPIFVLGHLELSIHFPHHSRTSQNQKPI